MRPFRPIGTHKFSAKRTVHYASKRVAEYANELALRKAAPGGDVLAWLEQVPIRLQGGVRYVCDFLVFMRDGSWKLVEIKGMQTPAWKAKMRQMAEAHPELFEHLEVLK